MPPKERIVSIYSLCDGDYFKFEGLNPKLWRELRVVKSNESSCSISGMHRENEDSPWRVLSSGYCVAPTSEVIKCSKEQSGYEKPEKVVKEKKVRVPKEPRPKGGKKGRKRADFAMDLPNREFTIKELAKQYNKSVSYIYMVLNRDFKGKFREVRRVKGGRGRAQVIYKKV